MRSDAQLSRTVQGEHGLAKCSITHCDQMTMASHQLHNLRTRKQRSAVAGRPISSACRAPLYSRVARIPPASAAASSCNRHTPHLSADAWSSAQDGHRPPVLRTEADRHSQAIRTPCASHEVEVYTNGGHTWSLEASEHNASALAKHSAAVCRRPCRACKQEGQSVVLHTGSSLRP